MNSSTKPPDAGALSDANGLTAAEREDVRARLAGKGIRLLPFPFGSALAIVSDVDGSSRDRYDGYIGMLVGDLGFDFGDSTWLRWKYLHESGQTFTNSFGFFSRHLGVGRTEEARLFDTTHTFNERIAEYHKGNVDHFHAFLSRGPRVACAGDPVTSGRLVEARLGGFAQFGQWSAQDVFVFAVCVVGRSLGEIESVSVVDASGGLHTGYRPRAFAAPADGRDWRLFVLECLPEADVPVVELKDVDRVSVKFKGGVGGVDRIMVMDATGEIILDRLRLLRDRYNVEVGLVTEHAGYHFRNPPRGKRTDGQVAEHFAQSGGKAAAYNGNLVDESGALVFATDADGPSSFGCVLPEISGELDVRFIVPAAATNAHGWNLLELVSPSPTASGGGIYWARRMLPNIREPEGRARFDRSRTRQDNFAARVAKILDYTQAEPGLCYPIYTHLGRGVDENDDRTIGEGTLEYYQGRLAVFDRYFESGPLFALQDRALNITGNVRGADRLWVTRASGLYDYALIARTLADHVQRPDQNTVAIRSWSDAVLGKRMPRSPAQLFGCTFYVDDAAAAQVLLDGAPLEHLVRNPPDETGRPSVTIAESEIRFPVFDRLDPIVNEGIVAEDGEWRWTAARGNEGPFGTLVQSVNARGFASLRIPMHGWHPAGAQALSLALRCGARTRFGIVLETVDGGRFTFGDASVLDRLGDSRAAAAYRFRNRDRAPDAWHTLVIPFWDIAWADGAAPGGPLPSHPLAAITLHCFGPRDASLDIAQLSFLRPRATSPHASAGTGWCVAGSVEPFEPGQLVEAVRVDAGAEPARVAVDQRGYFCFDRLATGVYRIWSDSRNGRVVDRRGALVDVSANLGTLRLGLRD